MAFVDSTTRIVRLGNTPNSPAVILKDTVTVEDVVFMYARTAAVKKLSEIGKPKVSKNVRQQITRVPHVR